MNETPIAAAAQRATKVLHSGADKLPKPSRQRIFTVANQKGGVGKTTTTVNVAAALSIHGLRVLVIDLDPQGNASTALGVPHSSGTPSTYELLLGEISPDEAIQDCPLNENLKCIPATIDLAGAEIELVSLEQREYRLRAAIESEAIKKLAFDYILIDCPPSLGLLTLNAMVAANEVLIPIQCEYYALEGVGQLIRNIQLVSSHLNPQLAISTVLLTMYDARTKLAEQVADEVRGHFGSAVLRNVIPRSVKVSEAPGYGMSVIEYDPGSRGAMSYLDAGREIAERAATTPNNEQSAKVTV
nr:ParA family protein [Hoyosella rhizosphaerae]